MQNNDIYIYIYLSIISLPIANSSEASDTYESMAFQSIITIMSFSF